jgi:hypothetical protein
VTDQRYAVPEEGLKAVPYELRKIVYGTVLLGDNIIKTILEAFIRWQDTLLERELDTPQANGQTEIWLQGWKAAITQVRRMYLAPPEPEEPEEIKDLLSKFDTGGKYDRRGIIKELEEIRDEHNADIREAYRRGKESGK